MYDYIVPSWSRPTGKVTPTPEEIRSVRARLDLGRRVDNLLRGAGNEVLEFWWPDAERSDQRRIAVTLLCIGIWVLVTEEPRLHKEVPVTISAFGGLAPTRAELSIIREPSHPGHMSWTAILYDMVTMGDPGHVAQFNAGVEVSDALAYTPMFLGRVPRPQ